jgi:hypothetical protein
VGHVRQPGGSRAPPRRWLPNQIPGVADWLEKAPSVATFYFLVQALILQDWRLFLDQDYSVLLSGSLEMYFMMAAASSFSPEIRAKFNQPSISSSFVARLLSKGFVIRSNLNRFYYSQRITKFLEDVAETKISQGSRHPPPKSTSTLYMDICIRHISGLRKGLEARCAT